MSEHVERVETAEDVSRFNMPYSAATKTRGGSTVHLSGVTAAPIYHSHPHVPEEFDDIPRDPAEQAERAMRNLERVLEAAGGGLADIVEMTRFIVDLDANQDAINRTLGRALGDHRPASTTVEVVRLATDPRLVLELKAVAVLAD